MIQIYTVYVLFKIGWRIEGFIVAGCRHGDFPAFLFLETP